MDLFILLGTLFLCFGLGMPISYSLGFGALVGALWIGIPPEAVMLQISNGVSKVAMLTIPFFVLAGAIMAVFAIGTAPGLLALAGLPVLVPGSMRPTLLRLVGVVVLGFAFIARACCRADLTHNGLRSPLRDDA